MLIRACAKHFVDAVGRGAGFAHGHEDPGQTHDAHGNHIKVGEECQDDPRFHSTVVHPSGPQQYDQSQTDIQAELEEGSRDGHDRAGGDVRLGHVLVGVGKTLLFIFRFGEGFHHPDAGDVLPHDPNQHIQLALYAGIHGDALGRDRQHDQNEQGKHDHQDHGKRSVHGQGHGHAAQEQHRRTDAQSLELLHGGLHIVAVGGHAGNEGGKTESVELVAAEVGDLSEKRLPHIIADAMGIFDGPAVGGDIEHPGDDGCGKHEAAPENDRLQLSQGHHIVDDVL